MPRPLSLSHTVQPDDMVFLSRGQTRLQLANALSIALYAPLHRHDRIWLMASQAEVFLTLVLCAVMVYKKKTLGSFWIITKRSTPYGTFYVANAVFTLVLGVIGYLIAFMITFGVVTAFDRANISSFEYFWIIPLPWLPLILGGWVSTHGFAVGCSPRSPLSTIGLCAKAGNSYYRARHFVRRALPTDIQHQMSLHVAGKANFLSDADQLASDELILLARHAAAGYFEVYRYSCINLAVYAACAYALFIPTAGYGIPNIMSLVDHTCSRQEAPLPASYTTYFHKLWFLLTRGKPTAKDAASQRNLATWKMTILANIYVCLMVGCVPAFGFLPIYIITSGFPRGVLAGNLAPMCRKNLLAVSIITICSCTTVAIFCTVATLDPLFRAAIGLDVIRTQVPIDINVDFERVEFEERDIVLSTEQTGKPSFPASGEDVEADGKRPLALTPSVRSIESTFKASATAADFSDSSVDTRSVVGMADGESAASHKGHADKIKHGSSYE
ncbi:hypothetical protein PSEUBRA_000778 [Kalmanozyma brasiliensis GHG001]|uniref:uncharacterized protein n=1 Tax=Kalmanozyma brasiliensis (strain GHG001) TaxID=1365824 RepID=UPI002867DBA2|nr:uncharacterized protein PSEUBRA_000778 [Kalmanozyma brasiliensis GHG001]EST09561.2 hypothetical protein PSEUBRA_000778 [Kalmanozyma brasiliensis GHG001]